MKKIIALLLVVLMLGTVTAFAEDTTIYTLSDPVVDINLGGEPIHLDLAGLSVAVSVVTVDEEEVVAFNIRGDGSPLLAAAFRMDGNRVIIDVDGLSHTYSAASVDVSSVSNDINLEDLDIDVQALMTTVMTQVKIESEGDTTRFEVPYTAINDIAEQLLPAIGQVTELPEGVNLDEVTSTVQELKETNSGLTIKGFLTQSDDGMNGELQFFVVENGETTAEPAVSMKGAFAQSENGFKANFDVFVSENGEPAVDPVMTMDLTVDDTVSMNVNIADVGSFHFGFDPATGKVQFNAEAEGQGFDFSAVIGSEEGELKLAELGDPASAIDVASLTDEDMTALSGEAMTAVNDLLTYLMPVLEQIM